MFSRFTALIGLLVLVAALGSAAQFTAIESARSHTATGAVGCTVSGATNATPIVITCSAAHNLVDGDQVQIINVGGDTAANTTGYAKVTGYSTTTFGLYSDSALATGVAGNGSYTSGGTVSQAYDISGISGDWTIKVTVDSLTAAKDALLVIEDSVDGFATSHQIAVMNLSGSVPKSGVSRTFRSYQLPSARFNTTNGRLRLNVQSLGSGGTVKVTWGVAQ